MSFPFSDWGPTTCRTPVIEKAMRFAYHMCMAGWTPKTRAQNATADRGFFRD